MDEKSSQSPTWRTMDKVSWSPKIFVMPTSWRWDRRKFRETMIFFIFFRAWQISTYSRRNKHHQVILLNWYSLRHIIVNQILLSFSRPQNMQWSHNMVHSHVTLCSKARDYIKWLSQHPRYGLWMRVQGSAPLPGHDGSWLVCEEALRVSAMWTTCGRALKGLIRLKPLRPSNHRFKKGKPFNLERPCFFT